LRRLEGGSTQASAGTTPAPAQAAKAVHGNSHAQPAVAGSTSANAGGAPADAQAVQDAYDQAFSALRNGQFVQSARQFRAFIQQHPHSALTPNAYYWLGESYYTVQNYDVALQTFQHLVEQFPDSDKTPGAMLKAGYCQDALNKDDAATTTLKSVIAKYPGSSVAKLAQQRLKDIALRQAN
jgi:tol-pal system protein YbgF